MRLKTILLAILLVSPVFGRDPAAQAKLDAYRDRLTVRREIRRTRRVPASRRHNSLPPSVNGHTMGWRGRRCGAPEPPPRQLGRVSMFRPIPMGMNVQSWMAYRDRVNAQVAEASQK